MTDADASNAAPTESPALWWSTYATPLHHVHHWHIGALRSWVLREENEWRIAWEAERDPLDTAHHHEGPVARDAARFAWDTLPNGYTMHRYSMQQTTSDVTLHPVLADRALIVRPEHAISIVPGASITLFVSTPLWVRVSADGGTRALVEMPTVRLSDTWFGASTRTGELCYAARTIGRLKLDAVPQRMHRAITPVHIRNQARDTLLLERVQVPAPHLALYQTDTATLWTQALTLEREADRATTDPAGAVHIRSGPPPEAARATRLTAPREPTRRNLFVSTFSAMGALFGS